MKVGTDAVLLGAWADVSGAKSILDIGTGCGVIALMLAQRSNAVVDAVDIDEQSAKQAAENFKNSPWKLNVFNTSIQKFEHDRYDLIVSNPPFFSKSLLPPKAHRKLARHTESLSFAELFEAAERLLAPSGRFAIIVPESLRMPGFHCIRETAVYTRNKPERFLLEFSRQEKVPAKADLILLDGENRSAAHQKLTQDFYL
jgi:tRNA1Val (adenine37-N6)-methyltransferase